MHFAVQGARERAGRGFSVELGFVQELHVTMQGTDGARIRHEVADFVFLDAVIRLAATRTIRARPDADRSVVSGTYPV